MKTIRLFAAALASFALLSISSAQAQHKNPDADNWMEKMKSEKIAFITIELSLTPEEAQVFWPVYNGIETKKTETQKAMMGAYFAMIKAVDANASESEIEKLLDSYIAAKQAYEDADKDEVKQYRKILPNKKVAKLYIAEEKFRRHQVRSMKAPGQGEGRPAQGAGPGPGPRK